MECTRRTALRASAYGAAVGAAAGAVGLAAPAAAATRRTARLERATFTPLVGTAFTIDGKPAKLAAVRDLRGAPAGHPTRFSLLFTSSTRFGSRTRNVAHETLYPFPLYLGPVGGAAGSFEAVVLR